MKQTVTIVGVGLIGGSIALSIKKEHNVHVIGLDAKEESLQEALRL
ncbi:hypothetical protein [Alteribacillus iranensis]|uniref:Prephenate dehydrogenase n=1 Tax=Alteribacillus iranensis TaxID=930128 RepID=A0A1I2BAU5_9BACI|nr:hypothetical protein [Alteribacillus iranensis]SFE53216.1 prephenate dehydrogenase [Alteribacillus iranensis]